jgi:hypothetical protein
MKCHMRMRRMHAFMMYETGNVMRLTSPPSLMEWNGADRAQKRPNARQKRPITRIERR